MKSPLPTRNGSVSPSEALALLSQKQRAHRLPTENIDPNTMPPESANFQSPQTSGKSSTPKSRRAFPPRPKSSSKLLKRKLCLETLPENGCAAFSPSDCGVQVIVRMRPLSKEDEGVQIAHSTSPNSISILEHSFTFDSVADVRSTQHDLFQLVGFPLVENCLAGFNSSIFAYGQTGSGKTYTMWGALNSLIADCSLSTERGLTPRVFERLFFRINEEHANNSEKQLHFQCQCSFLEIYNEQITDLLDPTQRNLQIREDVKAGIYVDCLTKEYVSTSNDVIQLLAKGLANRKIGETSINAESSRSHCVFTCIVECRSMSMNDGLINLRTSRINLVDLAGSERQKATGAAGERLKEAGSINRSLSQLGNLINILAEISQTGKQRHIPYRDSRLTFLLQDSLGGNAKLSMICTVSPSKSCKNETLSTLRFAQRAKAIKNTAIVNETTEDDANVLREQIRQLKDELLRMKSNGKAVGSNGSSSNGWNVRRSLSLLRFSLCRPRTLPVEEDSDEEMEIVHEGSEFGEESHLPPLNEGSSINLNKEKNKIQILKNDSGLEGPLDRGYVLCNEEHKEMEEDTAPIATEQVFHGDHAMNESIKDEDVLKMIPAKRKSFAEDFAKITEEIISSNIIHSKEMSDQLHDSSSLRVNKVSAHSPTLSVSPRTENYSRKSPRTSLSSSATQKRRKADFEHELGIVNTSFPGFTNIRNNSSNSGREILLPTESIKTSLFGGYLESNNHQHNLSVENSPFRPSIKNVDMVDIGTQTLSEEPKMDEDMSMLTCTYCKRKILLNENGDIAEKSELQIVPIDAPKKLPPIERCKKQVPKEVEKVLAGAIRRELALEDRCSKQAAEIMHLNRLVQQYKHERECIEIIERVHENKIARLEGLMGGIMPAEEFMEKELLSLKNEYMILKEKFENHPEVLHLNIELKKVQNELDECKSFFDMDERDVLLEEIQDLKCYLQCYIDPSSSSPLLQLTHLLEPSLDPPNNISDANEVSFDENSEANRRNWIDTDKKWASLCKKLKTELEDCRSLADKQKIHLESEKKCSQELKEALQTALQVHTRTLEHYADLEEKHISLLGRHRKMREGILDVKKMKGLNCEPKFIESLSAQIETLLDERDKERLYWRDENKGLQAQLRDTAEAVLEAGELLTRLKEAEDVATNAKKQVLIAEKKTENAYQDIDSMKKKYEAQIAALNQLLTELQSKKDEKIDFSSGIGNSSWFSGYDQCNI